MATFLRFAAPRGRERNHFDLNRTPLRWTPQGLRKWRQFYASQHPGGARGIISIRMGPHSAGLPWAPRARQGKARQSKARQGKAGQGRAGKARKARAGQTRQGKAKQSKARQGKARQGKAKQSKAKQGLLQSVIT